MILPNMLAWPPVFTESSALQDGQDIGFVLKVYNTLIFLHESHSTFTK
jgi:hypothetical protein